MSEERTTRAESVLSAAAWVALWVGFAWGIGLHAWGRWYSPSLAHRLQTDALLRGTLALQPTPHGQMADWAWGNGSQHVWGLGPALVRLPFEAAATVVGAVGFPDRVTLLVAFVAASLLCARAFHLVSRWERVVLVLTIVATPAFVTLCRTRLAVYEESVAYAHLWVVAMVSILLCFAQRRRDLDLFLVCGLAGLAPLMRPTLIVAAGVTVALAVALRLAMPGTRRAVTSLLVAGTVLAAGVATVGLVNDRRFGSVFETGQLLNVSYIPTDQAAKLFGYPFWHEPFGSAAAELVSSLVLPARWNAPQWYAAAIHPGQSTTVRFRELYFTTFTGLQLALLVASWVGVAGVWVVARRRPDLRRLVGAPVGAMAVWSATVFACLFAFYLWAPSMTSRYAVDFAAPFAVGVASSLMLLLRAAELMAPGPRARELRVVLASGVAVWVLHDIASADVAPSHRATPLLNVEQLTTAVRRPRPDVGPLPTAYRCGDAPESGGIKFNGSGWQTPGSCEVHAATMLFLERPRCVRLEVAPPAGTTTLTEERTSRVRAKLGLSEMRRVADVASGDGRALTFCVPADHRPNPQGIELLYLGWTPPAELSPDVRPFRLLAVTEVPAP